MAYDADEVYRDYSNKTIQLIFKKDSESYQRFGNSIVGGLKYPNPITEYHMENIQNNDGSLTMNKLVKICFKIKEGSIMQNEIDKVDVEFISNNGIHVNEIKEIKYPPILLTGMNV